MSAPSSSQTYYYLVHHMHDDQTFTFTRLGTDLTTAKEKFMQSVKPHFTDWDDTKDVEKSLRYAWSTERHGRPFQSLQLVTGTESSLSGPLPFLVPGCMECLSYLELGPDPWLNRKQYERELEEKWDEHIRQKQIESEQQQK